MKKIFIVVAVLLLLIIYNINEDDKFVIPEDAIRLRIIPNSNSPYDQYIKLKVKQNIEPIINFTMASVDNSNVASKKISNSINLLNANVSKTLNDLDYTLDFNIKYGMNYFPEKEYKDVIYKEGMYKSLVISLGDAAGDNWWCVLFPPICFMEFNEGKDIEYKFLVKDLFDKLR